MNSFTGWGTAWGSAWGGSSPPPSGDRSWGNSWGDSWGNSWGESTPPTPPIITDTHDGFWSRQWHKLKKREEKKPTIAEVVEIVKESPQVLEVVRAEVVRKYPQVNYAEVRENIALQRFIARQLIEAAQEEDDIETLLLMA